MYFLSEKTQLTNDIIKEMHYKILSIINNIDYISEHKNLTNCQELLLQVAEILFNMEV